MTAVHNIMNKVGVSMEQYLQALAHNYLETCAHSLESENLFLVEQWKPKS